MQQSVVCVRYELGTFWYGYVLTKNGYVLGGYILDWVCFDQLPNNVPAVFSHLIIIPFVWYAVL